MSHLCVLIPSYRPGPALREAVASVLAQEGVDLDLLVVDDASPEPVAASLAGIDDPRLRIVQNPVNLGLAGNWNRCLELAAGDPILIFHQDDRLLPGYLARAVSLLTADPSLVFVFSNLRRIDGAGRPTGGHWNPKALPEADVVIDGADLIHRLLTHGNFIPCPSVVVRRSAYAAAGAFNPALAYALDLDMWLRLAHLGPVAYLAKAGLEQRFHSAQASRPFMGGPREFAELRAAYRGFFALAQGPEATAAASRYHPTAADHDLVRRQLRRLAWRRLRRCLATGRPADALAFARGLVQLRVAAMRGEPC